MSEEQGGSYARHAHRRFVKLDEALSLIGSKEFMIMVPDDLRKRLARTYLEGMRYRKAHPSRARRHNLKLKKKDK